jgi:hypothetical protein
VGLTILDGTSLARVFSWMRPNYLVWNYWVANYLLGENPPAFDILAWNHDSTNLPAALHKDFMHLWSESLLMQPNGMTLLDTEVDLGTRQERPVHRRRRDRPHRSVAGHLRHHPGPRRRMRLRAVKRRPHAGPGQPAANPKASYLHSTDLPGLAIPVARPGRTIHRQLVDRLDEMDPPTLRRATPATAQTRQPSTPRRRPRTRTIRPGIVGARVFSIADGGCRKCNI